MFYWIYTKKNETKPIISRNFAESKDAVKFAIRNGKDWTHGDMLKKGERYGEFHKGKIRIGSKIASSIKPKIPKKVATNSTLLIRDRTEYLYALGELEKTSAKWKGTNTNPLACADLKYTYPIVLYVRRNKISWEPAILGTHTHNTIK